MKLKAAITSSAPKRLFDEFGSVEFARRVMLEVLQECLGAKDPLVRPAEYYLQLPDRTVEVKKGCWGVELRLTGASRGRRRAQQFHTALSKLQEIAADLIKASLNPRQEAQLFCVLMLDGDIEDGQGGYTSVLESNAEWVKGKNPS